MAFELRQTSLFAGARDRARSTAAWIEAWLERQREQIALWVPVALGSGIAAWFALPDRSGWLAFCCVALAVSCLSLVLPVQARLRQMMLAGGMLACIGCLLVWGKAHLVGSPPLARATFTQVTGEVVAMTDMPAQAMVRLLVRPESRPDLPDMIRVNLARERQPAGLGAGAHVRLRVRLMPPAPPAVPGGYDFARRAYFQGIGATGRALPPVEMLRPAPGDGRTLRMRLSAHVQSRVEGPAAGIAAALASGDQGAIAQEDVEAMRRSGLAHLLSISGLHVTALIGAVIFLCLRLLALSRHAALHWPLMLMAAAAGAAAGIGYTLLTGAEVPTIRSCIASLLVLGGLAMGRDAITLRLVATGALIVLTFWPDALVGPSFQMSFAAVIALVALGEHPGFRALTVARDEGPGRKASRMILALLLTGIVIELVLMPIALFHFHQAGLLGAIANLVAIPLTTFVVMPAEALALLLDLFGLGAPAWWVAQQALALLLLIAHGVAASPLAVMLAPAFGVGLFATIALGGLWSLLWRGPVRWLGLAPVAIGTLVIILTPAPDIVVTGDGRHVAVRTADGTMAMLRAGAGDYIRDTLAESAGQDGELGVIAALRQARCSADLCAVAMARSGRSWRVLATRSAMYVPPAILARDCAQADIVVSDRRLPRACRPRWLKLDRGTLARTGGIAINLSRGSVRMVRSPGDAHPWVARAPARQLYRRISPASLP
ncbi:ComEC/Rec2 family competence protein [Sphingobium sp. AN641]|uniref:ComEC/Rec2 family competence protein n=1 Tax=Sphingobium sp. AN641 TaxID=3133443 RepID=UPI0030C4B659